MSRISEIKSSKRSADNFYDIVSFIFMVIRGKLLNNEWNCCSEVVFAEKFY